MLNVGEWGTTPVVVGLLRRAAGARVSPARRASCVAALLVFCALVWLPSGVKRGEAQRSYFGVYRVQTSSDGDYHTLMHGTTLHGAQRVRDDEGKPVDDTDAGHLLLPGQPDGADHRQACASGSGEGKGRYGVIGLGAGSLACHSKAGEAWRFFEIDPVVDRHRQQSATTSPSSTTASPSPTS